MPKFLLHAASGNRIIPANRMRTVLKVLKCEKCILRLKESSRSRGECGLGMRYFLRCPKCGKVSLVSTGTLPGTRLKARSHKGAAISPRGHSLPIKKALK